MFIQDNIAFGCFTPPPVECVHLVMQKAGMKSKRHAKLLLQSMRKAGAVQTKPVGKGQNYVYALRTKKAEAATETPSSNAA